MYLCIRENLEKKIQRKPDGNMGKSLLNFTDYCGAAPIYTR